MDPREQHTSLERCETEAVGDEVIDRLHAAVIYLEAVSRTDDGFRPQFADYVIDELTRVINETRAYRRYLLKKPQREKRRRELIERRARNTALLEQILEEAKPLLRMNARINVELEALNAEERIARFPYMFEED